ncbi:hypothetical protein D3C80_1609880 [compost metagenome]
MILLPHLTLGLDRVTRDLPRVDTHHAVDPGRGHATFGQDHLDFEEGAWIDFVTAEGPRLQRTQQTRRLQVVDGLVRDPQLAVGLRRARL